MAARPCKRSWMCLGHALGGGVGFVGGKGIGEGVCLWRGCLRWLGQPSGESPSVPGLLHLPNMLWISPPPLCVCCGVWREVGGGGDYVWPWFRSVCHLPPRGLHRLLCLSVRRRYNVKSHNVPMQSGHLGLGTDTGFHVWICLFSLT